MTGLSPQPILKYTFSHQNAPSSIHPQKLCFQNITLFLSKIQCNSSDPDIIAGFNLTDNTAGFSLVEKELKIAESMKALWPNDSNYPPRNWIEQIRVYLTYSQIQYCKPLVQLIAASSNM